MHVELRPWTDDLKQDLIRICNNVDRTYLTNRLPDPYTEESADLWFAMIRKQEGTEGLFRAILADGKAVGNITIERHTDVYGKDAEIGYLLETAHWGKGIMTQAAGLICALAFDALDILRITSRVCVPNVASWRVLEKNGFQQEGLIRQGFVKNGQVYDYKILGKLKEDSVLG